MQNNSFSPVLFVLLAVLVLLSLVAIVYLYIAAKSRERLALIEKGMDPNLARSNFLPQVGIIGAGISVGLIVGDLLPHSTYGPLFAIFFAGAGLVLYNVMRRSKIHRDQRA